MKPFRSHRALLFSFLINVVVLNLPVTNAADVVRVQADSWMPFNGDPAAEHPGYVVELLREIFEPGGTKVVYQIAPWTDALKAAEEGKIDAVIGANRKEAGKLVVPEEAIAEPKFALFQRAASTWRYENLRSLRDVKLGAIEGYSYWESLDGYIQKTPAPAVKLYKGDTPLGEALTDLAAGNTDVVVENVVVFYWAAKKSGQKPSDFRIVYMQEAEPLYVAFAPTPEGRQLALLFSRGLRDLKASGRYEAILAPYDLSK